MNWIFVISAIAAGTNSVVGLSTRSYGLSAGYNKMRTVSRSTINNDGDSVEGLVTTAASKVVPAIVDLVDPDKKIVEEREVLKSKLFGRSAACDRGFGASSKDREEIASLVLKLSQLSPERVPTRGINPYRSTNASTEQSMLGVDAPIVGAWQMVYTTAFDVLSLAASPFTLLQGIYQVICANGTSVNVIDLAPRLQAIIPVQLQMDRDLSSTLRARVFTIAKARSDDRIGLTFKKVAVSASKFLNFDVSKFPKFGVKFPTSPKIGAGSDTSDTDPGYFDILYLDADCLIIRQNAPGGIFVNVRSDEPMSTFLE